MSIKELTDLLPTTDKLLALAGVLGASIGLSDVSSGVGIVVGVATFGMVVPRAVLNWIELDRERKRIRAERLRSLMEEAERESSDI